MTTSVHWRILIPAIALIAVVSPAVSAVTPVPPPSAAPGKAQPIVPGLTYTVLDRPGPQVIHMLTMRPNALLTLGPTQMSGSLTTRETLTNGMRARLATGATAGINADYFDLTTGTPSGILGVGQRLWAGPEPSRSALTIGAGGALAVGRLALAGRYQRIDPTGALPFPIRTFRSVNRPLPSTSPTGVVLFTPDLGPTTPVGPGYEALIAVDAGAALTVNTRMQGTVIAQSTGGGTVMAPGQVVIYGKNGSGISIVNELPVGSRVELEAAVAGIPPDAWGAVGGGPMLVQGGVAIPAAGEGFSTSQMRGRTTRTAVGQTDDGRILMVVSEGPQQGRQGYTAAEQGDLMVSLGAVDAIGFDSGGSSLMALGARQIIPWSSERAIADGLVATYTGAQLTVPDPQRVSPNGDGISEITHTTVQSPVAGNTVVTVARRGGGFSATLLDQTGDAAYNELSIDPAALGMPQGPYIVTTALTPADGTPPTTMKRSLVVDGTLSALKVSARTTGKGAKRISKVRVAFALARPARVNVKIVSSSGATTITLVSNRRTRTGARVVNWNGTVRGKRVASGSYTVVVTARSSYGTSGLMDGIRLR